MNRKLLIFALAAWLPNQAVRADPIHAVAEGAYWHHDSHWVFPQEIGGYVRVGIPQDVAGSEDAVAHYALVENGVRHVASVDVYRADSASAPEHADKSREVLSEGPFPVGAAAALPGTRRIYADGTGERAALDAAYFIEAGEWRVTIRISGSQLDAMDAFVRAQQWESLGH